jgi:glycosyltransferase involved in cell wall biosynthesis
MSPQPTSPESRTPHSGRLPAGPMRLRPLPERPLVSVLVPNYNYQHYLPEAIESVLNQTYDRWELIVCDDGSTDDSCQVVERYREKDPRISLIRQANGGPASALNRAYAASKGDVLCLLDADDAFRPAKLARVVERLAHSTDTGLLVHSMMLVDAQGAGIHRIPILGAFEEGWIAEKVIQRGGRWRYMPCSGLVFRRELAEFGFPIPPRAYRQGADGFLFTLFPLLTKTTYIDEELSAYRIHGSNLTGSAGMDAATAHKAANLMTRVIEGVNERLALMNSVARLRVEDNLEIDVYLLAANLLEGEPWRRLYSRYFRTVKSMVADDMYRVRQKVMLPLVYGCAALLPLQARRQWLNMAISSGRLKRTLVRFITARQLPFTRQHNADCRI